MLPRSSENVAPEVGETALAGALHFPVNAEPECGSQFRQGADGFRLQIDTAPWTVAEIVQPQGGRGAGAEGQGCQLPDEEVYPVFVGIEQDIGCTLEIFHPHAKVMRKHFFCDESRKLLLHVFAKTQHIETAYGIVRTLIVGGESAIAEIAPVSGHGS